MRAATASQASWAHSRERGTLWLMRLTVIALRRLGRPVMLPVVRLIALYFFVFGRQARCASLDYLRRVQAAIPESGLRPTLWHAHRHFQQFADSILDKLDAWAGRVNYDTVYFEDHATLRGVAASGRGVLIVGSHLGNLEICRALAKLNNRVRLNILVHTRHADYFNRVLEMAGASDVELVQVTAFDAGLALVLKERIARGEWVVIAADRVPVHGARTVDVRFLGGTAPLPIGPYVLAGLLGCPVVLLFCMRRGGRIHIDFERFAASIEWRRDDRSAVIAGQAQRFADRLEHHLRL
ncbi:MAG TPA: hypothetical protein VJ011_10825, partial [Steroidobacteraceae bacterium]|nr:hypothetical protein [Steroidobacteraceae bacterium]